MVAYKGIRRVQGIQVYRDNKPFSIDESYKHVKHSPTGFEWGYGGSGPAQLAFALLLDATGNIYLSHTYYMQFKWEMVANFKYEGFAITDEEILYWMKKNRKAERSKNETCLPNKIWGF